MGRQRLGILGGTFDPIHNGHLMIARAMLDKLGLDRILFIPDYIPPHKRGWHCSPSADRLAMTILAAAEDPRYTVSPMELDRGGVSYTCDTLRQLYRKWHRFYDLYFIIGADMVDYLPKWYRIDELVDMVQFVGVQRPRYKAGTSYPVIWVDVPLMDISSSMVRDFIAQGRTPNFLLPKPVLDYIEKEGLY